jgi:hypothetical protein
MDLNGELSVPEWAWARDAIKDSEKGRILKIAVKELEKRKLPFLKSQKEHVDELEKHQHMLFLV